MMCGKLGQNDIALTDMAFEALEKKARAGMTDYEMAAVISNAYMPRGGGQHLIFIGSTSMARPHLIFPNQFPTHRKTRKGDIVLTELSADYHMHAGQAHRPISVGAKPTLIYEKLYEVGVEAYRRILGAVKPGATHDDVRKAGSIIQEEGFTTFDSTDCSSKTRASMSAPRSSNGPRMKLFSRKGC